MNYGMVWPPILNNKNINSLPYNINVYIVSSPYYINNLFSVIVVHIMYNVQQNIRKPHRMQENSACSVTQSHHIIFNVKY